MSTTLIEDYDNHFKVVREASTYSIICAAEKSDYKLVTALEELGDQSSVGGLIDGHLITHTFYFSNVTKVVSSLIYLRDVHKINLALSTELWIRHAQDKANLKMEN